MESFGKAELVIGERLIGEIGRVQTASHLGATQRGGHYVSRAQSSTVAVGDDFSSTVTKNDDLIGSPSQGPLKSRQSV